MGCTIQDCDRDVFARGWCSGHYFRWRAHGDPLGGGPTRRRRKAWPANLLDRRERHESGCLLYTGGLTPQGYGRVKMEGRNRLAHVAAYELEFGPLPQGMTLDHVCHTQDLTCAGGPTCAHRRCVEVAHLEPVTLAENVRRSRQRGLRLD